MMKILIMGGFLGSGKTTSLMQLAKYLVKHCPTERENNVVILENELGEIGVDDVFLRSGGFRVDNIFSGCACCTVSGELTEAVRRIRDELDPEWLIIETTGVAYPPQMRENLESALGIRARTIILADAVRWNRLKNAMTALLEAQLEGAEFVLVNKTDAADESSRRAVSEDIAKMAPNACVMQISALNGVAGEVWEEIASYERP